MDSVGHPTIYIEIATLQLPSIPVKRLIYIFYPNTKLDHNTTLLLYFNQLELLINSFVVNQLWHLLMDQSWSIQEKSKTTQCLIFLEVCAIYKNKKLEKTVFLIEFLFSRKQRNSFRSMTQCYKAFSDIDIFNVHDNFAKFHSEVFLSPRFLLLIIRTKKMEWVELQL